MNPYEELIIKRLEEYRKRESISQVELAKRLGWRTADLNDILKGRRPLGKNRQQHIADRLGISLAIEEKHKEEPLLSILNDEDIEIALLAHSLTKEQKEALRTIILGLEKKKHKAA